MLVLIENFTFIKDKKCSLGGKESLDNLHQAKEKCSYNDQCMGLYDSLCDNSDLRECYVGSKVYEEPGYTCFYEKTGIGIIISCWSFAQNQ